MPTIPGLILQIVEATWRLSVELVPLLYLGFLGHGLVCGGEDIVENVVTSQRSYTLHYGVYTVAGLFAGSVHVILVGGIHGLFAGGLMVLAASVYGYADKGGVDREELDLGTWSDRLKLPWLLVPLLAVASLATGNLLLKSLVALIFLSAVFWEV